MCGEVISFNDMCTSLNSGAQYLERGSLKIASSYNGVPLDKGRPRDWCFSMKRAVWAQNAQRGEHCVRTQRQASKKILCKTETDTSLYIQSKQSM